MELNDYLEQLFDRKPGALTSATTAASAPKVAAGPSLPCGEPDEAYQRIKLTIHKQLVDTLDHKELSRLVQDSRRAELTTLLDRMVQGDPYPLSPAQRRTMVTELLDVMLGFGPLEPLFRDPAIGDIVINGTWSMFVERNGVLGRVPNPFSDQEQLMDIIGRIVSRVGRRVDESTPMVDARLPDGSRFNAIIQPLALHGPYVSIRRFGARPLKLPDLLILKSLTAEMARFLEAAVKAKLNILVSGGTGSGKTTLLNALSAYIPDTERIVTIEDAAEVQLQQLHVCTLESRPPNIEGHGEVTIRDLLRNALRMRPDRIVIGECRGAEVLDMLQAMNTGHDGSLTTLHANSPREALGRLETMLFMSGLALPLLSMRQQIAASINLIVQIERLSGGARRVVNVTEVVGIERDVISIQDLYVFTQSCVDTAGRALGRFEATGVISNFDRKLKAAGAAVPADNFRARVMMEV